MSFPNFSASFKKKSCQSLFLIVIIICKESIVFESFFDLGEGVKSKFRFNFFDRSTDCQALVAVSVIDFLIVILSLFGWLFSSRRRQSAQEDESNYGVVVAVRADGDCLVDIRGCPGVELDDVLNVEGGLGSLTVRDIAFFGTTVCLARPASDKMRVEPGARVTLAN